MSKTTTTAKSTAKPAAASKPVAAAPSLKFVIAAYKRPQRGHALWAHTAAFLTVSGMADGKAFPRASASKVIGDTAVKYHCSNGNFERTADGLKLTEQGFEAFVLRSTDPEMLAGFTATLSQGTPYPAQRVDAKDLQPF
jgi:hypothetical protein